MCPIFFRIGLAVVVATQGSSQIRAVEPERSERSFPAVECQSCDSLERTRTALRTVSNGVVFVYDLSAQVIYKYQVGGNGSVTEMVPVDSDVLNAFNALVETNLLNPDLPRSAVVRIGGRESR